MSPIRPDTAAERRLAYLHGEIAFREIALMAWEDADWRNRAKEEGVATAETPPNLRQEIAFREGRIVAARRWQDETDTKRRWALATEWMASIGLPALAAEGVKR